MISDFIQSWPLFWSGWLAAWLAALLLPLVGIFLVLRRQVFLAAAASQAAGFGVVAAMALGAALAVAAPDHGHDHAPQATELNEDDPLASFMRDEGIEPEPDTGGAHDHVHGPQWMESPGFRLALAVFCAVLACLAVGLGRGGDARIGALFVSASAGAMLAAGWAPHGALEIQRLLGSTLLTATRMDAALLAVGLVATLIALTPRWRILLLWSVDPLTAKASGISTTLLGALWMAWTGVVLGLAMYATGLLYTFACAILPVLAVRPLFVSFRATCVAAPFAGLLGAMPGLVLAHAWDLPPGPVIVLALALVAAIGVALGKLRA